ncbi:MAG: hypothetical protein WBK20_04890 [Spirochaetota bacterium]
MIIPLDKLIAFDNNRYIFSCAAMKVVDKLGNIEGYPESDKNWKVVPNILNLMLNNTIKYEFKEDTKDRQ